MKQHSWHPAALTLTACAALASCGNQESDPITKALKEIGTGLLNREEPTPAEPLTRAAVEASEAPLILVLAPARGAQALVYEVGRNGRVTTWSTADASTLSLRDGIVLASRGLGNDLMSAQAPTAAQVISGEGTVQRSYFTLDGEDRTQRQDFTCTFSRHASAPIEVVERQFAVHEVKETCMGAEHAFVNRYWITSSGDIVQSIQWLGTDVGFLQLADLSI